MGIFSKGKGDSGVSALGLLEEDQIEESINYNTVLDYLVGLSQEDYKKIQTVATVYRRANKEAAKALGIDNDPSTHIIEPEDEAEPKKRQVTKRKKTDVEEVDELTKAFLDDK